MENPRVENSSETGRNKMYSIENVMSFKKKIPQMKLYPHVFTIFGCHLTGSGINLETCL